MLYLVHHAEAIDQHVDPQRPLTPAGRARAERLAELARDRGVKPDVIWHSGKLRARQTAEPFWRRCNPLAEFAATRGLQPGDPPEWIRDTLEGDLRNVMLVGHMPHIARLFDLLTERERDDPAPFPQHGLAALEYVDGEWTVSWREE